MTGRAQDLADIEALERLGKGPRDAPGPPHLRGLKMTHAERLRWLEEAKAAFGRLLGRARGGSRGTPPSEHGG